MMHVSPTQLSVLRMIPIAKRVVHATHGEVAVYRLLNSFRGWDSRHTPASDARWAMARIEDDLGGPLPVCLVGHSLGGRAAILAASHPQVRSVVALAPWVYPADGHVDATGSQVLVVHGDRDRIASLESAVEMTKRLRRTAPVGFVTVEGGKHAMLRHRAVFDGLAAQFAAATLVGAQPRGRLEDALAQQPWATLA